MLACLFDGVQHHFQIYRGDHFYWCRTPEDTEKTTNLSQVTDKRYHIILYTSPWSRFELTTSVVIGTDCIGSCKSNYHTTTAMTAQHAIYKGWIDYLLNKDDHIEKCFFKTGDHLTEVQFIWNFLWQDKKKMIRWAELFCLPKSYANKYVDINLVRTTRFWNNIDHVRSKPSNWKAK